MNEPGVAAPIGVAGMTGASAGEQLRAARERQGLHLETLAASMKVPQRKLELLEADRIDELPDPTFTRALALAVCRVLKIDSEPVLARLPRPVADELAQVSLGLNEPFKDRFGGADGFDWRRFVSLPVIGGLVLVLGAAAVYWLPLAFWPKVGNGAATRVATPPPVVTETTVTTVVTPVAVADPATAAASAAPAASATGVIDTVFSSPAAPASAPVAGGMLMLRAAAESWIEVRDAAGRVLLSRSLAAGEAAGLDGALPLRVVVGNAEATQVTFRGQPVVLVATRDNVARLELK